MSRKGLYAAALVVALMVPTAGCSNPDNDKSNASSEPTVAITFTPDGPTVEPTAEPTDSPSATPSPSVSSKPTPTPTKTSTKPVAVVPKTFAKPKWLDDRKGNLAGPTNKITQVTNCEQNKTARVNLGDWFAYETRTAPFDSYLVPWLCRRAPAVCQDLNKHHSAAHTVGFIQNEYSDFDGRSAEAFVQTVLKTFCPHALGKTKQGKYRTYTTGFDTQVYNFTVDMNKRLAWKNSNQLTLMDFGLLMNFACDSDRANPSNLNEELTTGDLSSLRLAQVAKNSKPEVRRILAQRAVFEGCHEKYDEVVSNWNN